MDSAGSSTDDARLKSVVPNESTNPTYYGTIRHYFDSVSIQCMSNQFDLGSYKDVKDRARSIYANVASGAMPKGRAKWSQEWVDTFRLWAVQGCQPGVPPPQPLALLQDKALPDIPAMRVRKNVVNLLPAEQDKLKAAFAALMSSGKYRELAQVHADFCLHHLQGFYPWHRLFIIAFENALREIDPDIVMPYWDFTTGDIPDILQKAPFDKFTSDVKFESSVENADGTYSSSRNSPETVKKNYKRDNVAANVDIGMSKAHWEDFTGWSQAKNTVKPGTVMAHDYGHDDFGLTMSNSSYSSFDPIFWFYHCNWDRIWWSWQVRYNATQLSGFKPLLLESTQWLTESGFLGLQPFVVTADNDVLVDREGADFATCVPTIDSAALGVKYDTPYGAARPPVVPTHRIMAAAMSSFAVQPTSVVRVQGVERLNIPGNFRVQVLDQRRQVVAEAMFLQPNSPQECDNCARHSVVHFQFEVPSAHIQSAGSLSAHIALTAEGAPELDPLAIGLPEVVVFHVIH